MSHPIVSESQAAAVELHSLRYDPDRDPRLDHFDELFPEPSHVEELDADVRRGVGENVDDAGVAHFLRITPDPDEPDLCGGCQREWPCGHGVPLQVVANPTVDPELVAAVAAALREERESGRLA